jgi:polar amino acid transport system substrate-binding protein
MASCGGCTPNQGPQNALRWGGDQEGGGPYIYPKPGDPTQTVGFEVDLAKALGKRLGRPTEFHQATWDQILPLLDRGNFDLALNGYEFLPERARRYAASLPYYIYELGLCVRRSDEALKSWDDLRRPAANGARRRIGVLGASAADRYATEKFGDTCDIVHYDGSTEALQLVETGQLDATVQDLPILQFYVEQLARFPKLTLIGEPVEPGYYVLYARDNDRGLIADVNRALRELHESGELRAIFERYGIWNLTQEKLPEVWSSWKAHPDGQGQEKWLELSRQWPLLRNAAGVTILLALLSMPLAVAIGLTAALVRAWGTPALGGLGAREPWPLRLLRVPFVVYVEVIRGTPLAFQLWVVYFVLPQIGLTINEFWSGVLALAINYSAYEAEIFRLGLQAIPRGQMEAALSLGMSRPLAVRRIILPQAVRLVIPATANDFIALFKDTAVCSVIAVEELSKQYSMGAKSTGLFLEMAMLASLLYLIMSYPLSLLAGWLERRLKT